MKVIYASDNCFKVIPETEFEASYLHEQGSLSKLRYQEYNGLEASYVTDDLGEGKGKTCIYITASSMKVGANKEARGE